MTGRFLRPLEKEIVRIRSRSVRHVYNFGTLNYRGSIPDTSGQSYKNSVTEIYDSMILDKMLVSTIQES